MILRLPLPLGPNDWPKTSPYALQHAKDAYRLACWAVAIAQQKPPRDPPAQVELNAMFRCRRKRDETNMKAALKWVEDALLQKQTGAMRWRQGLYTLCGYFVNDDPNHLRHGRIWQERCAAKKDECLVLELEPATWETE